MPRDQITKNKEIILLWKKEEESFQYKRIINADNNVYRKDLTKESLVIRQNSDTGNKSGERFTKYQVITIILMIIGILTTVALAAF